MHRGWQSASRPVPSLLVAILVLALFAVGFPWSAGAQSAPDASVRQARVGAPTPDFAVEALRDSTRTFEPSDFEGRYVLLNLWATWCAPCLEKIPALQTVRERYSKETLAILNVSFDRSRSAAIDFLETREMPGGHAFAGISALGGDLGAKFARIDGREGTVRGLPNLALIGPEGQVVAKQGPASDKGVLKFLNDHL